MPKIKNVFSNYTSTPTGVVSQFSVLLEDDTILTYAPISNPQGKVIYGWRRLPALPSDLTQVAFLE